MKVTLEDVKEIEEAVCTEYLITKSINEIQQFKEGLDVLGMGNLLKLTLPNAENYLFITPKL